MLVIDSREKGNIEPVRAAFEKAGIEVKVMALEFGDYFFDYGDRKILIERKTPVDFIHSTTPTQSDPAGKLARQLNGCQKFCDEVVLLIDGYYTAMSGNRIKTRKITLKHSPVAFASKLRTVMRHGVRVEYNPTEWYLPEWLLGMYKNEEKTEHTTLTIAPKAFEVPGKASVKWLMLMNIRGVGPTLAKTLYNYFGSNAAIAQAEPGELRKVKGVGKQLSEEIWQAFH
jgi:ERCC4-type nuclease